MKRIYLNVSILESWDVSDEFTEDEAQALIDNYLKEKGFDIIYNDAEWDILPIREDGLR